MVRLKILTGCSFLFLAFAGTIQTTNAQNAGNLAIVPIVQASSSNSAYAPRLPVVGDGGCATGDCGTSGGYFQNRAQGGIVSRIRDMMPTIDISMGNSCGCQGECGCDKRRYRSFFFGTNDLDTFVNSAGTTSGSYRDGFVAGTARGQYINDCTRIELESTWRNNSGDFWNQPTAAQQQFDGHMNNFSTMVNVCRDFGTNERFNFYVGSGLGVSRQKGEMLVGNNQYNIRAWALAYQAFIGLNFIKRENADAFVEYRYFANANTNMKLNGALYDTTHYESTGITFGLRFKR